MSPLERYRAQARLIEPKAQAALAEFPVAVIGCGGLGGAITEQLVRLGFLNLQIWDKDVFSLSNLNRQRFSTEASVGCAKVEVLAESLKAIDKRVNLSLKKKWMTRASVSEISGIRLLFDALDSAKARLDLEYVARELNIPYVHGALNGPLGQVGFFRPEDQAMTRLYAGRPECPADANLPMTVNVVSALQVSQGLSYALGAEPTLAGKLLLADLESMDFHTLPFT